MNKQYEKKNTKSRPGAALTFWYGLLCFALCLTPLRADETEMAEAVPNPKGHSIHFVDVPVVEFVRFVSKISKANFIYDHKDLNFNVTLSTGKPVSSEEVVRALVQMLKLNGLFVSEEENYFVIHKGESGGSVNKEKKKPNIENLVAGAFSSGKDTSGPQDFFVYKLKYHEGSEIESAIKKIGGELTGRSNTSENLLRSIQSLQWVKATNSLLASGDAETIASLKRLIETLDVPLKQVFIEVLVIETDVRKSTEFGLQWAGGGQYKEKIGFGMGSFPQNSGGSGSGFASALQGVNASNGPTGLGQIPIGKGFDMGVIGDIIMHRGLSYLSLGALVSALQADGDSTIVLNQKIIAQDSKNSTIFVGDNIPFTGSIISTVGQSQQTTANIEYRDIGVNLSITPRLGEGDIITLDIDEEITESVDNNQTSHSNVNGIRTTKTNMATHVHVPDQHFLVLSGMIRNAKSYHKAGLPCLGGLPIIGNLFSKTKKHDEKRNVIIFVRPHIIRSFEDYENLTNTQKQHYDRQSRPGEFPKALEVLPKIETPVKQTEGAQKTDSP